MLRSWDKEKVSEYILILRIKKKKTGHYFISGSVGQEMHAELTRSIIIKTI